MVAVDDGGRCGVGGAIIRRGCDGGGRDGRLGRGGVFFRPVIEDLDRSGLLAAGHVCRRRGRRRRGQRRRPRTATGFLQEQQQPRLRVSAFGGCEIWRGGGGGGSGGSAATDSDDRQRRTVMIGGRRGFDCCLTRVRPSGVQAAAVVAYSVVTMVAASRRPVRASRSAKVSRRPHDEPISHAGEAEIRSFASSSSGCADGRECGKTNNATC